MQTKVFKRGLLWGLILISIGSLLFTPFDSLKREISQTLPWVGLGVIVSEIFFIGGLAIMALSIGMKLQNPLKLRGELKRVLRASITSRGFWVGFWINAVGAVTSSILLAAGIFAALPMTSWGLLYLPVADLAATIVIRQWALRAAPRA